MPASLRFLIFDPSSPACRVEIPEAKVGNVPEARRLGADRLRPLVHRRELHPGEPRGRRGRRERGTAEPADHALGRSYGGFETKLHLVVDSRDRPSPGRRDGGPVARADVLGADPRGRADRATGPVAWPATRATAIDASTATCDGGGSRR